MFRPTHDALGRDITQLEEDKRRLHAAYWEARKREDTREADKLWEQYVNLHSFWERFDMRYRQPGAETKKPT